MSSDQTRHIEEFERLWPAYSELLRARRDLGGGMQWKPVAGADYLTRYWADAVTGKKVAKSMGRRSLETESLHADFMARREAAEACEAELEPQLRRLGSFARVLRMTRLPAKHANGLRNLAEAGWMDEGGILVSGAAAVLLYETKCRLLAPIGAANDDCLAFMLPADQRPTWERCMEFGVAFGGRKARVQTLDSGGARPRVAIDGLIVTLHSRDGLDEAMDDLKAPAFVVDAVTAALRRQPVDGFLFARDATPAPVRAPDPRAFCLLAPLLDADDRDGLEAAWRKVDAVEEMVQDGWPERFSRAERSALEEIREFLDSEAAGPLYP